MSLLLVASGSSRAEGGHTRPETPVSLLLITLDTTRADYIGAYGGESASTPNIDELAASGLRYEHALSPSPLTLPSHASLFTGLHPPEHGVRDNGISSLPHGLPTLASRLGEHGFETAAFVGSRVLDHRFGLDHGFEVYDDRMTAERTGEYGYPERDAAAVTTAARNWLAQREHKRPFFLWVHYYDPHFPYAPGSRSSGSAEARYASEISFVDEQIGYLLASLPSGGSRTLVAAVGDHGEALGEHGERTHGLFLYASSLRVPMILAGPGVPRGSVVAEKVTTTRLGSSLLRLLEVGPPDALPGTSLPGLAGADSPAEPVYSETRMPSTVYGWSSLRSIGDQRWRLVAAPRPELYDTVADPGELVNLYNEKRSVAGRLARNLRKLEAEMTLREASAPDDAAELGSALRALGYLSGSASQREGDIDPKDGLAWLDELREAKELLGRGQAARALELLESLNRRSPDNVPFLANLARAQEASGLVEEAIGTMDRALKINPQLDFLYLDMGSSLRRLGRIEDARKSFEAALELNPRSARAWMSLAEIANSAGNLGEELRILRQAQAAGTASVTLLSRLAELEFKSRDLAAADETLRQSIELEPDTANTWLHWGDVAAARSQLGEAAERFGRAATIAPASPTPLLRLAKISILEQDSAKAREYLLRALALQSEGRQAEEARRLLASLPAP